MIDVGCLLSVAGGTTLYTKPVMVMTTDGSWMNLKQDTLALVIAVGSISRNSLSVKVNVMTPHGIGWIIAFYSEVVL